MGHWLNGRAGLSELGGVVLDLCARAGVTDADVSGLRGAVSGYVADAPAATRDLLEPLMAAYDFDAVEREGRLTFFHRGEGPISGISTEALSAAASAAAFSQRSDAAETPVEARIRFVDAQRDYMIGAVSARRLDRAEGGVVSLDAPIVLEPAAAEQMAHRLLADNRAAQEGLRIELGPEHMALEPGDLVRLGEGQDTFEVARIEDAGLRELELRRLQPRMPLEFNLSAPPAAALPPVSPSPAVSVLDLPLMPGAEFDDRPFAAVFASPWTGAHYLFGGAALDQRAEAVEPAIMGELLWALWPGPVDRWDEGNVVRVKLFGGALESVSKEDLLNGANAFAVESGGEWEIIQARSCVLVAPGEYDLSGFLRGRLGSGHAMRSPHPVGARIVKLDHRLTRLDVAAHEWGEPISLVGPPSGTAPGHGRDATFTAILPHAAHRPWAPAHLRAQRRSNGDVSVTWIRSSRIGGDAWGAGEPPLGEVAEQYLVEILSGDQVRRSAYPVSAAYLYEAADQIADFGFLPGSLRVRVAQVAGSGVPGLKTELTITL